MANPESQPATSPLADRGFRNALRRAGYTLWLSAIVVASLLTFPSSIPWMIAAWLSWHTGSVLRGRPSWFPLVTCAVIVLVKRTGWPPGLITLAIVLLALGALGAVRMRKPALRWPGRFARRGLLVLWIAWGAMALDWHASAHCGHPVALQGMRPIVCLGDSLTAGDSPRGGYPKVLQELVSLPVVDMSQQGVTSADVVKQLPSLIAADPQVVVIELGGNDFVQGSPRDSTRANLEKIIATSHELGAEVVLVEIPRGFMTDPFAGLERELARKHDLELVPDTAIRKLVLWSPYAPPGMWTSGPYLSDDGLHPNAYGNEHLARAVLKSLVRMYGPQIRADNEPPH